MKHLGDITKINGSTVMPVQVIIGGSPCQDLSVAGKRAGLQGERSGLFMEEIRIIKEMRQEDIKNGRTAANARPRYMVWENVPGTFNSNKGQDFKVVLEETVGVIEKNNTDIPIPDEGWHYSGTILGAGWSIAWRVFDSQFWGVPQRRRRIALVADFGGFTAPEILFERKGMFRDNPPSGTPWKEFAAALAERFGTADKGRTEGVSYTLNTVDRPAVYDARGNGDGETVPTITGDHENRVTDYTALCVRERCGCKGGGKGVLIQNNKSGTLAANNDQFVIAIDRATFNQGENALYEPKISEDGINSTLTAKGPSAVCAAFNANMGGKAQGISYEEEKSPTLSATRHDSALVTPQSYVRRLTPLECERLQGFPDNYTLIGTEYNGTDGKKRKVSDSARYKALGNSIALPSWVWVLERLSFFCGDDKSMASLFDGIGGFPLIWETLNGEGTCLWASEIEEFPISVTKYHFNH